jgi:cysteine desulfurase
MALDLPVYLDNHATTKVDPRVVESMLPYFAVEYGNAASRQHEYGWRGEAAVELARKQVGEVIGAAADEMVFTSGATESINLALKGVAGTHIGRGRHIVTATTEHRAVLDTCQHLERYGFTVTYVQVDRHGLVRAEDVASALTPDTILVSIMTANNEIGTIAPIEEIASVCRNAGVLFHTDATQAVGKIAIDAHRLGIDLLSFSAHKMYGPKGIGALFVRSKHPKVRLETQIDGGGHEHGLRSGTLNVPGIVGFGKAAELAMQECERDGERTARLRDKLVEGIKEELDDVSVNGHPARRLPNNASLTFPQTKADTLMMEMKDVAVSSGSACSSASPEPSHVLRAIGLSDADVLASLRFGLGRFTTEDEIDFGVRRVVETVKRVRSRRMAMSA